MKFRHSLHLLAFTFLATLPHSVLAHEADETTQEPGFRPHSEYAAAFVDGLDQATIAVSSGLSRGARIAIGVTVPLVALGAGVGIAAAVFSKNFEVQF
jgi:hypothetical protein